MTKRFRTAAVLMTTALAACSGGATSLPTGAVPATPAKPNLPVTGGTSPSSGVRATITLRIMRGKHGATSARARHSASIQKDAAGLILSITQMNAAPQSTAYDLTNPAICTTAPAAGSASSATCTIAVSLVPDVANTIVGSVFDAAPMNGVAGIGGTIPPNSGMIDIGSITATPAANAQTAIALKLNPIESFGFFYPDVNSQTDATGNVVIAIGGGTKTIAVPFQPADYDGGWIAASTVNTALPLETFVDPSNTPVVLSASIMGGSTALALSPTTFANPVPIDILGNARLPLTLQYNDGIATPTDTPVITIDNGLGSYVASGSTAAYGSLVSATIRYFSLNTTALSLAMPGATGSFVATRIGNVTGFNDGPPPAAGTPPGTPSAPAPCYDTTNPATEVATISGDGHAVNSTFSVVAVAPGTCTIHVTENDTGVLSAPLSITVGAPVAPVSNRRKN